MSGTLYRDYIKWKGGHRRDVNLYLVKGQIRGSLGDLNINGMLLNQGDNTIDLSGRLRHVTNVDQLSVDLNVARLKLLSSDIESLLPANTLPAEINLPDVMSLQGTISGTLASMQYDLAAQSFRNEPSGGVRIRGSAENPK